MAETRQESTREERLAAKLRENLRRRKAQAREIDGGIARSGADTGTLPKPDTKS